MYIVVMEGELPTDPNKAPRPRREDETNFYYFFGVAMAAWQDIELFVAVLYGHLVSPIAKERLGGKASDQQRVDNCKVPLELRGPKPRPDQCGDGSSTEAAGAKR